MNQYSLRLYSPAGAAIAEVTQYSELNLAYGQGTPGVLYLTTAAKVTKAQDFAPLTMLEVYRQVDGIWYLEGERIWWLMDTIDFITSGGLRGQQFVFYDANAMLQGRRVLYQAESAQAAITAAADDLLKDVITTNCTASATDTSRAWPGLSVQADLTSCTSISKAFAWRPVLTVMQEVCAQAAQSSEYLTWDFVRTGVGAHEFRTYTGQRGVNRGSTSGQTLRLTAENGGLTSPRLQLVRQGAANHVTAAGRGEETARATATATDSPAPSGMMRFETMIDRRNVDNDTDLQSEAYAEYQAERPRYQFEAQLGETPSIRYGLTVNYGDLVSAAFSGYEFDCHVRAVKIRVDDTGNETLEVKLRNYE